MSVEASETLKRITSIITTLEQKRGDLLKAESDLNRLTLMKEKIEKDLSQVRRQLVVEISKLDPELQFVRNEEAAHA